MFPEVRFTGVKVLYVSASYTRVQSMCDTNRNNELSAKASEKFEDWISKCNCTIGLLMAKFFQVYPKEYSLTGSNFQNPSKPSN